MYYIGKRVDCEAYNSEITQGENYQGSTSAWDDVISHPNGVDYAIRKHDEYTSTMTEVSQLGEDWFPSIEE